MTLVLHTPVTIRTATRVIQDVTNTGSSHTARGSGQTDALGKYSSSHRGENPWGQ